MNVKWADRWFIINRMRGVLRLFFTLVSHALSLFIRRKRVRKRVACEPMVVSREHTIKWLSMRLLLSFLVFLTGKIRKGEDNTRHADTRYRLASNENK